MTNMEEKTIIVDAENAERTVGRFEEVNGSLDAEKKKILRIVSSHSRFLGNSIIRNPRTLSILANEKSLAKKRTLSAHRGPLRTIVKNSQDPARLSEKLKEYKYKELCRIIYREIKGICEFRCTLEEISDLAIAIVRAVLDFYRQSMQGAKEFEFVVLGMGKLGGRLLNLSSDIDLIYLYRNEQYSEEILRLSSSITKAISSISAGGFLYRVDLGLRPGGNMSPVAVSIDGALEHYFHWAETWERAVLLKAAPIAGDLDLGSEFIKEVEPVVYRKLLDYESIDDLKSMKERLESLRKKNDVKLGQGGIREIEFFVQVTQLVNGGAVKKFRGLHNTLDGLATMAESGFITQSVEQEMSRCYLFLRKVEHSIQLWEERQTHMIPEDEAALSRISARMGFDSNADFMTAYEEITSLVLKNYRDLFFKPGMEVEEKGKEFWEDAEFTATDDIDHEEASVSLRFFIFQLLLEGNMDREEAVVSLQNLGFQSPDTAADIILRLLDPKRAGLTEKGRMLSKKVVPAFLSEILKQSAPDTTLLNLDRFLSGLGSRMSVYALLNENPEIISLLTKTFSRKGMLSDFLIRHPEYLDSVILKDVAGFYDSKESMDAALREEVHSQEFFEDKLNALRSFKHTESLKLCFRELSGDLDPLYVGKYLSMVADVVMDSSLEMAREDLRVSPEKKELLKNMIVLGLGKLGGEEMSYTSDLDIIFIYEGDDHELFSKYGQRFISNLSVYTSESFCYKVDLELRPSGNSGTLVTSLDAFAEYHASSALMWERQALVKARVVAGNRELGKKAMKIIDKFVYSSSLAEDFHKEIYRLRARIENELSNEDESTFNLKSGKGGIIDIEFLVQMLQLAHGRENPDIRTANTMDAIRALDSAGFIESVESEALTKGYIFLRRMGNMLSLLSERAKNEISQDDFERMAEEFGLSGGDSLRIKYLRVTEEVRVIYDKYFLKAF